MGGKKVRQHYFVARELQASIAVLVILALLGGTFLLYLSKELNALLGVRTPFLTLFLMLGYAAIVAFSAIFFTHRLVGPFKRLEYEMKMITKGDLSKRLSIRRNDDWHVRSFVAQVNALIERLEEMSMEYNKLNSILSERLAELSERIRKGEPYEDLLEVIEAINDEVHRLREKW